MPRQVTAPGNGANAAAAPPDPFDAAGHQNSVVLIGRIADAAADRTLPSGDVLVTWRVVVRRPSPSRAMPDSVRGTTVDTINCASWRADVRRAAGGWSKGDLVRIEGSLRRRFWRTAAGTASRCEVEVTRVRRLARASP
jgi:single-strand DNA-binding protein